jgi:hypothetical protein
LIITTGTAGGTLADAELGDVVITRAARFRLADEFRNETFNSQTFTSTGDIPTAQLAIATGLLDVTTARLHEPDFGPPTTRYPFPALLPGFANTPRLLCDGIDFPALHPILTTDFFEFGTSTNHLGDQGCGVEMGDASSAWSPRRSGPGRRGGWSYGTRRTRPSMVLCRLRRLCPTCRPIGRCSTTSSTATGPV